MFRHRPTLAPELLADAFDMTLPAFDRAQLGSGELTPTEHRADTVVELRANDTVVLAVVVEVQLRRDLRKRFSWPVYLTSVRARLRCPAVVLVICPNAATAAWFSVPVALGPGSVFTPMVVGPGEVPLVADARQAADNPELAVLSAMAHGSGPDRKAVLEALPAGLVTVDDEHLKLYYDLVLGALPVVARRYLEELMTVAHKYQSDFARKYVAEGVQQGRQEGRVEDLLEVLGVRAIDVPADARGRITSCTDAELLKLWLRRAVTASTIEDVLR